MIRTLISTSKICGQIKKYKSHPQHAKGIINNDHEQGSIKLLQKGPFMKVYVVFKKKKNLCFDKRNTYTLL